MKVPHSKILIVSILFTIGCYENFIFAQTSKIKKLEAQIASENNVRKKADLYSELAEKLFSYDFEKGLTKANEALKLSIEDEYKVGQAKALTLVGNYHYYNGNNKEAFSSYMAARNVIRNEKDNAFPAKVYLRLSILFRQQGEFDSAQLFLDSAKSQCFKNVDLKSSWLASQGILFHALSKNDAALNSLRASLQLREKSTDSVRIADTWRNIGVVYTLLAQYDSARNCFEKAKLYNGTVKDPEVNMTLSLSLGQMEFLIGNFEKAIDYYSQALTSIRTNTYKRYYAAILLRMGELYENQGAYHTAYDYLFNALQEFEKLNARQDMAQAYSQIGWCYNFQGNYDLALENSHESIRIATLIKDSAAIAQNQNLIGFTLYKQKKYKEAIPYFDQSLVVRKKIKHWWGVSFTLYNTALTYLELGNTEKSIALLFESLSIDERIGKKAGIVFSCNELGRIYTKEKKYTLAKYYLNKAGELAKQIPIAPQLLDNYKNYITFYESQGNQQKTIAYFRLYTSLKDSLSSEINSSRVSKADALFQLQKKAAEIVLINKENELHQTQIKTQQQEISFQRKIIILITVSILILIAAIVIIYRLFKSNQKAKDILRKQNMEITEQKEEIASQSEELTESNEKLFNLNASLERRVEDRTSELNYAYKELETFFYRTSHDFRRPLTTYLGLVEVANATLQEKQALELFDKVKITTHGLDNMLAKLQSISDVGEVEKDELRLITIVELTLTKFTKLINEKNIKVVTDVAHDFIRSNQVLLKTIFENLIENAIYFSTRENAEIKIVAKLSAQHISIVVEDNGQGIEDEQKSRIFEMYHRASDNSKGNGLGLYIVKRLVNKVGGTIAFTSEKNKGSSFQITLPRR